MKRAVVLAGVLCASTALAQPDGGADAGPDAGRAMGAIFDEATRSAARDRNRRGLRLTRKGDQPRALAAFREAHALDPTDPEIANNLGYLHLLLGNRVDAERYLLETLRLDPRRTTALDNLAELLEAEPGPARQAEAARRLAELRTQVGNAPRILRRQAQLATRRGRFDDARRFYGELVAAAEPDDRLAMELGDFHRTLGEPDLAISWYRKVSGDGPQADARRRIEEMEVEREARRFGWISPGDAPPVQARERRDRGRAALGAGRIDDAVRLLSEAVALAPTYADAYADLGDAHRAARSPVAAEIAYLRALVMDGTHVDAARRLGEVYDAEERWADAATMWTRALTMRPEQTELHVAIARAWKAAGDLPRALHRVRLGLAALPEDAPDDALRDLERELVRLVPDAARQAPEATPPSPVGQALARARAHLARGETNAALNALAALPPEMRGARVHALEGRIFSTTGRRDAAIEAMETALRLEPDQPELWAELGRLLLAEDRPEDGRAALRRAAEQGDMGAELALLSFGVRPTAEWSWLTDIGRLGALQQTADRARSIATADAEGPVTGDAQALATALDARVRRVVLIVGGAALAVLVLALLLARRRWGGWTLAELVDRHPEAGPDVQRVLSAIRHEVLKHNTLAVSGLADALEADADIVTRAAWVRQSLLGDANDPRPDAAIHRLRGYAEQLRQIGRQHRRRLNLRRRDPALSALLGGFARLEGLAGDLDRIVTRGRVSGRVKREVRAIAQALNVTGLGALRVLLDQLRLFDVDVGALRSTFDRTRREPGFADVPVAPLVIEGGEALPARIEMPRTAFEDVLANLMRNAIQSSARAGAGHEVVIGLAVEDEDDPITGLCAVRFRVRDRSTEALTTEMLRGRFIEDGLGLTGDLVTRYDGSLHVEDDVDGWRKAVVLTLPRAELADTAERSAVSGLPEEEPWTI